LDRLACDDLANLPPAVVPRGEDHSGTNPAVVGDTREHDADSVHRFAGIDGDDWPFADRALEPKAYVF